MKNRKNVLVVGFGVSGLCVTEYLKQFNCNFKVVDNLSQFASKTAGGLINPLSLKRLKPIWKVESFFSHAVSFYQENFPDYFKQIPIFRIFSSIEEQNDWFSKLDKPRLSTFLSSKLVISKEGVKSNYKLGEVLSSATIDLSLCLEDRKHSLKETGLLFETEFIHENVEFTEGGVLYDNEFYNVIIFAEGYGVLKNPYFNSLPIYGNQGEYIIVSIPNLKNLPIIKGKHFLIPLSKEGTYKFGATYNRDIQENVTTQEATNLLSDSLSKMITEPFDVIGQVAGIRPTTKDRHPVVGRHPKFPHLSIINGMGSRGVICAPLLAQQLVRNLLYDEVIMKEASIDRFTI